jgi:putative (di)nucleoside polyphosphate hydrolase
MISLFKKYRAGIGIVLVNAKNQVFIGQKSNRTQTFWQLPQGGIEVGEAPAQAAKRELLEETGITDAEIIYEVPQWIYYQIPSNVKKSFWRRQFSGQKQKWFLMRFRGTDKDINLKTQKIQEFSAWKWIEFDAIPSVAPSFKQESYKRVHAIFKKLLAVDSADNE